MEVLRKAFSQPLHPAVSDFVGCIEDDAAIIDADITGSMAHCAMLASVGLITAEQQANIEQGLKDLRAALAEGKLELRREWEDVHMNIEKQLYARIGLDALRLHTARSRNDQVALDMRIYVCEAIEKFKALIKNVQHAFAELAASNADAVMPGYTHLQRAQPVLLGHGLHAFIEMLERDAARFADAAKRTRISPLGAGALSGSSLPIDPSLSAASLGFDSVFANSMDAVTDRDFLVEFLSACSLCAVHLSQIAETFILWATSEFQFITLGDEVTTASSLMPNKRNPDPLEIIRAKCGGISGDLVNLLMTLKGLPLGYNRDLQETKPPVIRSVINLEGALTVMAHVVAATRVNKQRMQQAASDPLLFATDLVEYLIRAGMPMRQAHDTISDLVAYCREQKRALSGLTLSELQQFSRLFANDVFDLFDPHVSVGLKTSPGGTAPANVASAIDRYLQR